MASGNQHDKAQSPRRTPTPSKHITLQAVARRSAHSSEHYEEVDVRALQERDLARLTSELALRARSPSPPAVQPLDDRESETESSTYSDDSGQGDEEVKLTAPNELLLEFVTCMMEKDYLTGEKLCQMILMYEPDHEEARAFQGLIEEQRTMDAERQAKRELLGLPEEESSSSDEDVSREDMLTPDASNDDSDATTSDDDATTSEGGEDGSGDQ